MGSPLVPALANIFMCNFGNRWLKDCPHGLKPAFHRRYVNGIFVFFSSSNHAEKFREFYLPNIAA